MNILSFVFGMTLTYSPNSLTLLWNQVNVPISVISNVLQSLGAKVC